MGTKSLWVEHPMRLELTSWSFAGFFLSEWSTSEYYGGEGYFVGWRRENTIHDSIVWTFHCFILFVWVTWGRGNRAETNAWVASLFFEIQFRSTRRPQSPDEREREREREREEREREREWITWYLYLGSQNTSLQLPPRLSDTSGTPRQH